MKLVSIYCPQIPQGYKMDNSNKQQLKNAGLRYINEDDLCFKRRRNGKGFVYLDSEGEKIKSKKLIQRFESLVIPPAWEKVQICSSDNGHIQATGRDSKGRKQYIYHADWEELSNTNKFNRMIEFGQTLPLIRKHVGKDLKKKSLLRNKVLAVIIRLMEETLIRIGNEIYAEQNKSYGLTTLKDKHIEVNGFTLNFQFNGKGGKPLSAALTDKTLAKIVKKCQDLPGQKLFQYLDEEGKRQPVESADVNNYLNNIVEKNFTAKDFRTWGATVAAAEKLNKIPLSDKENENNRNIVKAVKQTAEELNNTPAICRKYYIHPHLIQAYLDGYLFKAMSQKTSAKKSKYDLDKEEKAVLNILKKYKTKIK
jgi:DNA topoisomerase-1